jgi:hypothetical protein
MPDASPQRAALLEIAELARSAGLPRLAAKAEATADWCRAGQSLRAGLAWHHWYKLAAEISRKPRSTP